MRFASLGSGSKGNALLIESDGARILIDCGFSVRETVKRLARLSVSPDTIDAVLVTHEHGDHASGAFGFCDRFGIPVYMTKGTRRGAWKGGDAPAALHLIDSHRAFSIKGLDVTPFPIPHDAFEPVQFVVSDNRHCVGVLTDAGKVTPHIVLMLEKCDALVLECNHDVEMLSCSNYPAQLKRRIFGEFGHLSNDQAAVFLQTIGTARLQHVVAAHLSEQNNRPELALAALSAVLDGCSARLDAAHQKEGFSWRELG
ncbi:MAG: MBL fold metallo-hydrolase [Candidatus Accumulibacter sp.]|jgi:phosphoribosyl 1,2-cyclic phosphodiesterase|nr:MBL fold metallo-hydrolase [Accumulibacter sp.]